MRAFITGVGIGSPAGRNVVEVLRALIRGSTHIGPPTLFPVPSLPPLPTGEIPDFRSGPNVPRTHALALEAARQAMKNTVEPPDAIVMGVTTGGLLTTEGMMLEDVPESSGYRWHATGTVTEYMAEAMGCTGPVLTVSTACSSGAVAMKVALELIRSGKAHRVLAGGADSLTRLTYYGFSLLKLIDPDTTRPFDLHRSGMNVGEAAATLLVEAGETPPLEALAELRGGGLSCDAHHVTAPQPEGEGALAAMREALADARVSVGQVDYLNLHGTGTRDNDAAEARAELALFGGRPPALSSTKGVYGHPLAAAGAVEAVISVLCITKGIVPANVGFTEVDPDLGVVPVSQTERSEVRVVLSNSFGFGGNNAAIVLAEPVENVGCIDKPEPVAFRVLGSACLSGAGETSETLQAFSLGRSCMGTLSEERVSRELAPAIIRRLRRLPRLALSVTRAALSDSGVSDTLRSVYFGTGFGALSETRQFLHRLFESKEKFSSPTDFIGSLHSSPASQIAILHEIRGPNITVTGTDDCFEEALYCAGLMSSTDHGPFLCLAADESDPLGSPRVDPCFSTEEGSSDGAAAVVLEPISCPCPGCLHPAFVGYSAGNPEIPGSMIQALGGPDTINRNYGALFAGVPRACGGLAGEQLSRFLQRTGFQGPVVDYRSLLGEFGSVSATACVMAHRVVESGVIPRGLAGDAEIPLKGRGILILGFGRKLSAITVHG